MLGSYGQFCPTSILNQLLFLFLVENLSNIYSRRNQETCHILESFKFKFYWYEFFASGM